ncbi:MAG: glycosylhydrolase-like jelly roll fold domain-containing protein [Pyrinomonadaceae bacterium]
MPGESLILKTLGNVVRGPSFGYFKTPGESERLGGAWFVNFVEGGPELPPAVQVRELGSWTKYGGEAVRKFSGTARYTISFTRPQGAADAWLFDLGRVAESARVRLNGRELGTMINPPFRVRVPQELLKEQNTLEVSVANLMANRIADLDRRGAGWKKFYNINFPARRPENRGEDGLFNASRWEPKDSGLIGPVTLVPLRSLRPE